jgi:hypothetical protein
MIITVPADVNPKAFKAAGGYSAGGRACLTPASGRRVFGRG